MSDLISRSALIKALSEAEDNYRAEHHDCVMNDDPFSDGILSAMFSVFQIVKSQPTAYSVDKVIEEIIEEAHNTIVDFKLDKYIYTRKAIEIVKQGGVTDDVCEWRSTQINNEWKPSCEPNSTYNVFGVAWFKRCPYCGKKIKVVDK